MFVDTFKIFVSIMQTVPAVPTGGLVAGMDLTIASILQWTAAIAGLSGLVWGIREKRQASKQGSQTIEKNTFDHLMDENKKLLNDLHKYRKLADKFWILRDLASKTEQGRHMIIEAEELADRIDGNEDNVHRVPNSD